MVTFKIELHQYQCVWDRKFLMGSASKYSNITERRNITAVRRPSIRDTFLAKGAKIKLQTF